VKIYNLTFNSQFNDKINLGKNGNFWRKNLSDYVFCSTKLCMQVKKQEKKIYYAYQRPLRGTLKNNWDTLMKTLQVKTNKLQTKYKKKLPFSLCGA
jgi:hypothetical protein